MEKECHYQDTKIYHVTNRHAMKTTQENFNYSNKAVTLSHLQQQARCSISDFKSMMTESTVLLE
jgi:hypothetical protein